MTQLQNSKIAVHQYSCPYNCMQLCRMYGYGGSCIAHPMQDRPIPFYSSQKCNSNVALLPRCPCLGLARMLKYSSLVLLTVQNCAIALVTRQARARPGDMFIASTAVLLAEVVKSGTSLILLLWEAHFNISQYVRQLYVSLLLNPRDNAKIAIPAVVYVIQNNLIYLGVSNLDAATFQVTVQLKILTTALLSVFILHKPLSRLQWVALVILFVGVSLVQLFPAQSAHVMPTTPNMPSNITNWEGRNAPPLAQHSMGSNLADIKGTHNTPISSKQPSTTMPPQNALIGFSAVVIACFLSGFAGVYYELILKSMLCFSHIDFLSPNKMEVEWRTPYSEKIPKHFNQNTQ